MKASRAFNISPERRFETGIIATLVRGDETRSVHVTGLTRDALGTLAAVCDAEGWRVRTISTPRTIYRDLQGTRRRATRDDNADFPTGGVAHLTEPVETNVLGKIGRADLAEVVARP